MAGRSGHRHAAGGAAGDVQGDRVGAAVGRYRDADGIGHRWQAVDHQAVGLGAGGAVGVGGGDGQVEGAAGARCTADDATAGVQAQAGRQAAGGDRVGVGRTAAGGGDGLVVGRALGAVGQCRRGYCQGGRADSNGHRSGAGGAAGVGGGVGEAVAAGVTGGRGVGDAGAAGGGGAMAGCSGHGHAAGGTAAQAQGDRVGAAVGGHCGADRPDGRGWHCVGITVGQGRGAARCGDHHVHRAGCVGRGGGSDGGGVVDDVTGGGCSTKAHCCGAGKVGAGESNGGCASSAAAVRCNGSEGRYCGAGDHQGIGCDTALIEAVIQGDAECVGAGCSWCAVERGGRATRRRVED